MAEQRGGRWREAWRIPGFRLELLSSALLVVVMIWLAIRLLPMQEIRRGVVLTDPVLPWLDPMNTSWMVFLLLYSCLILAVVETSRYPEKLAMGFRAYGLLVLIRVLTVTLIPLEPPPDMIDLADPFLRLFWADGVLRKDLFFSGHSATACLTALFVRSPWLKGFLALAAMTISILLLMQHVHYTIDVIFAPFFATFALQVARTVGCYQEVLLEEEVEHLVEV